MIPIEHQPPGYWATNLYTNPRKRPKSDAPIKDLPPRAAQRFKQAREGIRALKHVTEQVVFMGTAWKWVWMYEVGGRKLAYLHPMEAGVSGTFVLSEPEERELAVTDGLPTSLRRALRGGRGRRVCRDHPAEASIPGAPGVGARHCRAPTPGARRPRPTCAPFAGSATFRRPQAIPHATDTFAIERP